jgi:hypothetical protein
VNMLSRKLHTTRAEELLKKCIGRIVSKSVRRGLISLCFVVAPLFVIETYAGEEFPKCNLEVGSVKYIAGQTQAEKVVTELKDYKLLKSNLHEEDRLVLDSHLYKPQSKKIKGCLWQIFVYTDKRVESRRSLWNIFLVSNNQVLYLMNSEGDFESYQNHNR